MTTDDVVAAEEHIVLGREFVTRARLWVRLGDHVEERRMYAAATDHAEAALVLRPLHFETATQAMEWAQLAGQPERVAAIRKRFRAAVMGESAATELTTEQAG